MTWAAQEASGSPLLAGFECGRLHWNGHDLLHSTGHLPDGRMQHDYATAVAEGATGARDGLSWRHDVVERVRAVPDGFPVIWDFAHFDLPPRPAQHALACAMALPPNSWAIAVNEP